MIFYGQPGLGKTAMGKLIATEMSSNMMYCIGKSFIPDKELVRLKYKDILFVDEVHRLNPAIEELMYEPLADFSFTMPSGLYRVALDIHPFTFIGSTTLMGKVSKPLRDRCRLNLHFQRYRQEDIATIVVQAANKTNIQISNEVPALIAQMARGVPRIALRVLDMCRDVMYVEGADYIGPVIVARTQELLEMDIDGLTKDDITYMKVLWECNRPIGQKALAKTLSVDEGTISEVIEPFLIEEGYIMLTDTGRALTQKGVARIRE
jgi:Holliday junction DNA helicase RuvB